MLQIKLTDRWHQTFEGGHVGVLLIRAGDNTPRPTPLDAHKRTLEANLREKFAGYARADFLQLEILQAYRAYYKQFGKTYHVQLQLESVVLKNKALPTVTPLVDANFSAELETLVLTAGHDADQLVSPLTIDATQADDPFTQINGKTRLLKPNDMAMRDGEGVICTIIYGQDARTRITPTTQCALYVAYAPVGVPVAAVERQLDLIQQNVALVDPSASVEMREIYRAGGTDV